jgi:small subunit ribosomal protein S15
MADKKPEWVKMKPSEVEALVIELAKKGETPQKIGLILRDTHGIPKIKLVGKRISKIINEANLVAETQKARVDKKIKNIEQHIAKNKHDYKAQRSLNKNMWIVNKLKN